MITSRSGWRTGTHADYVALLEETPFDRIQRLKAGVPATQLSELSAAMGIPRQKLCGWVGISSATAKRRPRANAVLSVAEGERLLGVMRLVGLVEKIVVESGNLENFDAARWAAQWLDRPNAALEGRSPGEFMDTEDGRQIVRSLISQMQSGAYS